MLKTILILSLWIISGSCSSTRRIDCFTPLVEIERNSEPTQELAAPLEDDPEATWSATIFIGSNSSVPETTPQQNYEQSGSFEPAQTEVELHERISDKITALPIQGDNLNHAVVPSVSCVVVLLLIYLIFKKGRV